MINRIVYAYLIPKKTYKQGIQKAATKANESPRSGCLFLTQYPTVSN